MATIQIRIDDNVKMAADELFSSLGLDTSTAVRMFISAAIESDGIPFAVRRKNQNSRLRESMEDAITGHNLIGPFATAQEAVRSMLED
jgi:DNA-damage-inducible protein J